VTPWVLAASRDHPLRTTIEAHPLEQANVALERLREGVDGAAVLMM
jgi:hypothetical protein